MNPNKFDWLLKLIHIDFLLLCGLFAVSGMGLIVLYSSGRQDLHLLIGQAMRLGLGFTIMLALSQVPPSYFRFCSAWLYLFGTLLLLAVMIAGDISKGAQRWLDLGILRFQPSEVMKLAVPMMMAEFFADKPLPPRLSHLIVGALITSIPFILIAGQPDLGTALVVGWAGAVTLFLAGLSWLILLGLLSLLGAIVPLFWTFIMHDYQRQRVITFLNPESDPLGTGYHIIQSKIAIGSGGIYGKGWMNGTQSHLDFLPEGTTDFIFAAFSEEFGLVGGCMLLTLYFLIISRCLYMATRASDTYGRLLSGSLTLIFFIYAFVNVGMVSGLLPVVGLPLPLFSYGGTSLVTIMAGFGMLMSIYSHRIVGNRCCNLNLWRRQRLIVKPPVLLLVSILLLSSCALPVDYKSNTVPIPSMNEGTVAKDAVTVSNLIINSGQKLSDRPDVKDFIQEMVAQHRFNAAQLHAIFNRVQTQHSIISAISRPAEAKPWHTYRTMFINTKRIQGGVDFWKTHSLALERAEQIYGIPPEYIIAIIGVETQYGSNMGKYRVLDALSTLAFYYPRRAAYFRKELENFLLLTRAGDVDPLVPRGSYAGAMGYGQFMPSSFLIYAVDFDRDGHRDLWRSPWDAIGSIANYFKKHGWQIKQPVASQAVVSGSYYSGLISRQMRQPLYNSIATLRSQGVVTEESIEDTQVAMLLELQGDNGPEYWLGFHNFYVITRYNCSHLYAMAVYQLSQAIRERYVQSAIN
jgi:rod shape determining protein RodA